MAMFRFPVEMEESTERDERLDSMLSAYTERALVLGIGPSEVFN